MPDGHPTKEAARPWINLVDGIADAAYRCRVVNRAWGTQLTPAQIEAIPDETVEALMLIVEENAIGDTQALLRAFLESR